MIIKNITKLNLVEFCALKQKHGRNVTSRG